jgi:hypothetical protein
LKINSSPSSFDLQSNPILLSCHTQTQLTSLHLLAVPGSVPTVGSAKLPPVASTTVLISQASLLISMSYEKEVGGYKSTQLMDSPATIVPFNDSERRQQHGVDGKFA